MSAQIPTQMPGQQTGLSPEQRLKAFFDGSERMPHVERLALLENLMTEPLRIQIAIQNIKIMLLLCVEVLGNRWLYELHAEGLLKLYFGSRETVRGEIISKLTKLSAFATPSHYDINETRCEWKEINDRLLSNAWEPGKTIKVHFSTTPIEDNIYFQGMADKRDIIIATGEEPFALNIQRSHIWKNPSDQESIDDLALSIIELLFVHEMTHIFLDTQDIILPETLSLQEQNQEKCYGASLCQQLAAGFHSHLAVENADNIALFLTLVCCQIWHPQWCLESNRPQLKETQLVTTREQREVIHEIYNRICRECSFGGYDIPTWVFERDIPQ